MLPMQADTSTQTNYRKKEKDHKVTGKVTQMYIRPEELRLRRNEYECAEVQRFKRWLETVCLV